MRYFVWVLFVFCSSKKLYSQNHFNDSCTKYFKIISYFWKLDSLGRNGYRMLASERLTKCNKVGITQAYLEENLGKPNRTSKDNLGSTYYLYYYFDGKALPKQPVTRQNYYTSRLGLIK